MEHAYDFSIGARRLKNVHPSAIRKVLERAKPVLSQKNQSIKSVSSSTRRRENTLISILLSGDFNIYQIIKQNVKLEDIKDEINIKIVKKLYEEFEKGNSNINSIIDTLEHDEQNRITEIMSEDYEITDMEKAIDDIIKSYEKERLDNEKNEIIEKLSIETNEENKKILEKRLSEIVINLAKIK